jgi:pyruvate dehydrogenase E2 component (dihydrolipoamide acetyltransferase)
MEQGTIISWFKQSGDRVEVGEELLEIETDKSTAPVDAEVAGTIEILAPVGTAVKVGEPIARVTEVDASTPSPTAPAPSEQSASLSAPTPPAAAPAGRPARAATTGSDRLATATPLARRAAAVHGIELAELTGTGPLGRITRNDVLARAGIEAPPPVQATPQRNAAPVAAPARAPAPANGGSASAPDGTRSQVLTRLQQVIARRMADAKATVPHFQVQTEVRMDAAIALREQLTSVATEGAPVPSFNDLIVKAAAVALRSHPLANGSYRGETFELHDQVNVGVAVAADNALVVPTVFAADTKSVGQIASETRRLAAAVRDGSIAPHDLDGGTFTVSNLGMFGMTAIFPVINPPQAAILGVGSMRSVGTLEDGEYVEQTLLTLTLSCDHRILYGADAARFLAEIRDLLQTPLRLAL